jgi:hypothetical protein
LEFRIISKFKSDDNLDVLYISCMNSTLVNKYENDNNFQFYLPPLDITMVISFKYLKIDKTNLDIFIRADFLYISYLESRIISKDKSDKLIY